MLTGWRKYDNIAPPIHSADPGQRFLIHRPLLEVSGFLRNAPKLKIKTVITIFCAFAQDYVAAEFEELGYEVTRQDVSLGNRTAGDIYLDDLVFAAATPSNNSYYTGFGTASGAAVYLSDPDAVVFGSTNKTLDDLASAPIKWAGKSLILDSKVCLNFIFSMGTYTGDASDLSLHVSYTDTYGATKEVLLTDAELYNEKLGYYAFTLDTMLAAELRSVVSVQVYSDNTPVSCTLQYSADTYGNNKEGTLLDLCKALFAYSDSAKAYFAG